LPLGNGTVCLSMNTGLSVPLLQSVLKLGDRRWSTFLASLTARLACASTTVLVKQIFLVSYCAIAFENVPESYLPTTNYAYLYFYAEGDSGGYVSGGCNAAINDFEVVAYEAYLTDYPFLYTNFSNSEPAEYGYFCDSASSTVPGFPLMWGSLVIEPESNYASETFYPNYDLEYYHLANCLYFGSDEYLELFCGVTCFHSSSLITYDGSEYSLASFLAGNNPACVVPHVVHTHGVAISTDCVDAATLRLTRDHLVWTQRGYERAGALIEGDVLYSDEHGACAVRSVRLEYDQEYFGLNCEESEVLANGYRVSTFGHYHSIPAMWMKWMSKVIGVESASALGDVIAHVVTSMQGSVSTVMSKVEALSSTMSVVPVS